MKMLRNTINKNLQNLTMHHTDIPYNIFMFKVVLFKYSTYMFFIHSNLPWQFHICINLMTIS